MSEATPVNVHAFSPFKGGLGARLSVTTSSSRIAIPGLEGGQQGENSRVVVSNSGLVPAYVLMGQSDVTATTSHYEILPGTKEVLSPPFVGPRALYIAAITSSGETTLNICAGEGT